MAYKTPSKTSEYIRGLMSEAGELVQNELLDISLKADKYKIPILLPEAAAFLRQLLLLHKPCSVLEIGTAIGFSGCLFLLNSDCHLTTIDKNAEYLASARQSFDGLGFSERCNIIEGDSDLIVPSLNGSFDFIFLDGPKTKYVKYLPYLKNMLKSGGILLADNVLFNGMVAGENPIFDKQKNIVSALDSFMRELYKDKTLITSIINVGDGMSLSIKC